MFAILLDSMLSTAYKPLENCFLSLNAITTLTVDLLLFQIEKLIQLFFSTRALLLEINQMSRFSIPCLFLCVLMCTIIFKHNRSCRFGVCIYRKRELKHTTSAFLGIDSININRWIKAIEIEECELDVKKNWISTCLPLEYRIGSIKVDAIKETETSSREKICLVRVSENVDIHIGTMRLSCLPCLNRTFQCISLFCRQYEGV